jgi:hypothetical protein
MIAILNKGQLTTSAFTKQLTGEKIPGDLDAWDYFGTDPNSLLTLSYGKLSQRSTTLYHSHGPVTAAVNKSDAYAIGPGLVFRSQPDWRMLGVTKEYARDWGMEFQRLIHYHFLLLNFYQKQSLIFRTADIMGDGNLFFDRLTSENGLPFDIIETGGDQIDFTKTYKNSDADQATLGIKHDKYLRKQGIFQADAQGTYVPFTDENGDQNVIQFYHKKMARQLRGMPIAYRMIALAKNNDRWWDAMLQRAVMETIMIGYKEGGNPASLNDQVNEIAKAVTGATNTDTGLKTEADIKQLGAGNLFSFNSGESLKFTDLKTPSGNFDKMQKAYIEIVGMCTDMPPEVLMSQYSTSFTAHKGALNDFVKFYMAKRNTFIRIVCNVLVKEIAKHIFLTNQMSMPHPAFFTDPIIQLATLSGNWLGPVPGHINPKVEVEAKALEVENAFRTRADAAADYGNEFDNIIEEWTAQETLWQKMSPEKQAAAVAESEEERNSECNDEEPAPVAVNDNTEEDATE